MKTVCKTVQLKVDYSIRPQAKTQTHTQECKYEEKQQILKFEKMEPDNVGPDQTDLEY